MSRPVVINDKYLKSVSESTLITSGIGQYCRLDTKRTREAQAIAAEALALYRDGLTEHARALWTQAIRLISTVH